MVLSINCFEPNIKLLKPIKGFNDYFKFNIFACNYIGVQLHIMGYGLMIEVRIYNPSKHYKSESNNTHGKTD